MLRRGLAWLLLGVLAWGQAVDSHSAPSKLGAAGNPIAEGTNPAGTATKTQVQDAVEIPPAAPVITITGLCENPHAAPSGGAHCETVVTRGEFEKLIETVQPEMPARVRRLFANNYARALIMSDKAVQMGLDKDPAFQEHMRIARIQILSAALNKAIQERAALISEKDVEDSYHNNISNFEQVDMERIYVPKSQPQQSSDAMLSTAERSQRTRASLETMKTLADKLRRRAVDGEDFTKLQADAYRAAGLKSTAPDVDMGKIMRSTLPSNQALVMELKPGEISSVIEDQSSYLIYRVKSKRTLRLDEVRDDIKSTLRTQRTEEQVKEIQGSVKPTLNEGYFAPPLPKAREGSKPPSQESDSDED